MLLARRQTIRSLETRLARLRRGERCHIARPPCLQGPVPSRARQVGAMGKSKSKEFPEAAMFFAKEGGPPEGFACVDIGANLTDDAFAGDVEAVLDRARQAGVRAIVLTGTSVATSRRAVDFAQERSSRGLELFATAGVHPHHAKDWQEGTEEEIEQIASHPKCVAIGECGLDFDRNFSPPESQRAVLRRHVALAQRLKKPLFLHCREAINDLEEILQQASPLGVKAVSHCFTGGPDDCRRLLALGLHVGITGWICDDREGRAEALREAAPIVPKGRLMVETDCPYLTPRTIRPNKARPWRNEPCLLPHVVSAVAAARGEGVEECAEHTTETAVEFFGIA